MVRRVGSDRPRGGRQPSATLIPKSDQIRGGLLTRYSHLLGLGIIIKFNILEVRSPYVNRRQVESSSCSYLKTWCALALLKKCHRIVKNVQFLRFHFMFRGLITKLKIALTACRWFAPRLKLIFVISFGPMESKTALVLASLKFIKRHFALGKEGTANEEN